LLDGAMRLISTELDLRKLAPSVVEADKEKVTAQGTAYMP
jgi:hypothetical protein